DPGLTADAMVKWLDEAEIPGSAVCTDDLRQRIRASRDGSQRVPKESREGTADIIEALQALNAYFPTERVYVGDVGRFMLAGWTEIDVETPRDYVYTHGFTSIGLGLGEAIGAAMASGGRPTLLLVGDGGLMLGGFSELA